MIVPPAPFGANDPLKLLAPAIGLGQSAFAELYRKSVGVAWRVDELVWPAELKYQNPLESDDYSLGLPELRLWQSMKPDMQIDLRRRAQRWQLSQILHGEFASLKCAARIATMANDLDETAAAAAQAIDEVRHIEVYSRLLGLIGELEAPALPFRTLLEDMERTPSFELAVLGMQILLEGVALAYFQSLQLTSQSQFVRRLFSAVARDEARHFACGRLSMGRILENSDQIFRNRCEDYAVHACEVLGDYLLGRDMWLALGLDRNDTVDFPPQGETLALRSLLFGKIEIALRDLGLCGPKLDRLFEQAR